MLLDNNSRNPNYFAYWSIVKVIDSAPLKAQGPRADEMQVRLEIGKRTITFQQCVYHFFRASYKKNVRVPI